MLAAGAGGLAALPFLRPIRAAAEGDVTKNIIFWFQPVGVEHESFWPAGGGHHRLSADNLVPALQPLAPYVDRLTVMDGIQLSSAIYTNGSGSADHRTAPHDTGCAELWTSRYCRPPDGGQTFSHGGIAGSGWTWPAGDSLDQFLAKRLQGDRRFGSLEAGVWVRGNRTNRRMSFRRDDANPLGPGFPVDPENDPQALFMRVFGDAMGAPVEAEQDARRRRSELRLLDRVRGRIRNLERELVSSDREVLDRYVENFATVESALRSGELMCDAPELAGAGGNSFNDDTLIPQTGQNHMRVLAAAMACQSTSVGSMLWLGSEPRNKMSWLTDEGAGYQYHACSHLALAQDPNAPDGGAGSDDIPKIDANTQRRWLRETDTFFSSQLAFLCAELERWGILDDTLIIAGNELSIGRSHTQNRQPFLMIGGGWHFETGWFRDYRPMGAVSHGHLLAEIAQAFGQGDVEYFGDEMFNGGFNLGLTGAPV